MPSHQALECPRLQRQAAYRIDRLVRSFRLPRTEAEDLMQDLFISLVRALRKYDPERSPVASFLRGAMDRWYCQQLRKLGKANPHAPTALPDEEFLPVHAEDHEEAVDRRLDVEYLVHQLPPSLAQLACQLGMRSVAEIAEHAGVHRGTAYRWVGDLQEYARRLLEDPRDSSP